MSEATFKVTMESQMPGNPVSGFWVSLDDGGKYCPTYVQQSPGMGMKCVAIRTTNLHEDCSRLSLMRRSSGDTPLTRD